MNWFFARRTTETVIPEEGRLSTLLSQNRTIPVPIVRPDLRQDPAFMEDVLARAKKKKEAPRREVIRREETVVVGGSDINDPMAGMLMQNVMHSLMDTPTVSEACEPRRDVETCATTQETPAVYEAPTACETRYDPPAYDPPATDYSCSVDTTQY